MIVIFNTNGVFLTSRSYIVYWMYVIRVILSQLYRALYKMLYYYYIIIIIIMKHLIL